jgi:hypothetical protein
MSRWLKQSTSVDLPIGPFLDAGDGITAETALTLTQPDIRLKKNGGAWAQKAAAQTLSHEENGFYEVTLDATDTDTLGHLRLAVFESGACPVWEDFLVVSANIYDSLVAGSDTIDTTVTAIGAGAITAAAIATGAIDADAIATDAVTEIQSGLATASALSTADGKIDAILVDTGTDIPATLVTIAGYLDTEIAAIKAKTDNLPADPADASDVAAAISALLTTAMTESYSTDGGTVTVAQALYELLAIAQEKSISGTTMTVKKRDGSTTALTLTLNDATTPTAVTRSA